MLGKPDAVSGQHVSELLDVMEEITSSMAIGLFNLGQAECRKCSSQPNEKQG